MNETYLSLLLIALSLALIAMFIAVLWQLRSRFGAERRALEEYSPAPIKQEPKTVKSSRKRGTIVIARARYEFDYNVADEESVKKLLDLIKSSLALLKESKYPDIIASRARECEALIKRLKEHTNLRGAAIAEIVERFRRYASNIADLARS
ncbi:MAG: hypothetical protein LBQ52_01520 [Helicobacteraceae bacterium]|nr:hypothetical protein [Helicobacteraceae bacterium]